MAPQTAREERMAKDSRSHKTAYTACPDCDANIPGVWEAQAPQTSNGTGIPRPVGI